MTIFFAADHHFQHSKIITFRNKVDNQLLREFDNIQDHDNHIIEEHNKLVGPDDLTYFLGDVTWKTNTIAKEILAAMNGRKRLVVGNHDDVDWLIGTGEFEKVYLRKYFPEHNLIASHVPLVTADLKRAKFNVHGHIHENSMKLDGSYDKKYKDIDLRYLNVGMELSNYKPTSLEDVLKQVR